MKKFNELIKSLMETYGYSENDLSRILNLDEETIRFLILNGNISILSDETVNTLIKSFSKYVDNNEVHLLFDDIYNLLHLEADRRGLVIDYDNVELFSDICFNAVLVMYNTSAHKNVFPELFGVNYVNELKNQTLQNLKEYFMNNCDDEDSFVNFLSKLLLNLVENEIIIRDNISRKRDN